MSKREQWYLKNKTNRYFSIGDLPKLPSFNPKETHDMLTYHSKNEIENSSDLKDLLSLGWVSLTKTRDGSSSKYNTSNSISKAMALTENEEPTKIIKSIVNKPNGIAGLNEDSQLTNEIKVQDVSKIKISSDDTNDGDQSVNATRKIEINDLTTNYAVTIGNEEAIHINLDKEYTETIFANENPTVALNPTNQNQKKLDICLTMHASMNADDGSVNISLDIDLIGDTLTFTLNEIEGTGKGIDYDMLFVKMEVIWDKQQDQWCLLNIFQNHNNSYSGDALIVGQGNNAQEEGKSLIIGKSNSNDGDNTIIVGEYNGIYDNGANQILCIGDHNNINSESQNLVAIGTKMQIDENQNGQSGLFLNFNDAVSSISNSFTKILTAAASTSTTDPYNPDTDNIYIEIGNLCSALVDLKIQARHRETNDNIKMFHRTFLAKSDMDGNVSLSTINTIGTDQTIGTFNGTINIDGNNNGQIDIEVTESQDHALWFMTAVLTMSYLPNEGTVEEE